MNIKIDTHALKLLESDFNDILRTITKNSKFKEFKTHYQNMLIELKNSH